ncbi:hypothetical protein FACS1894202_04620 [Clostridia bacterium]|nr:hypothetical protein FACS1894202_04620 [Clostridia bacterium]
MLGKTVTVIVDRAMGTYHPEHPDIYYPINYGYIENVPAPDGEEQDAYILGVSEPAARFIGRVVAIIHRNNDVEDKWVVAPGDCRFTEEEILEKTRFQEQYFDVTVELLQGGNMNKTVYKGQLTTEELSDAIAFARRKSETRGYKLDVKTFSQEANEYSAHILYYERGAVRGYASINNFGEPEATFICDDETAFDEMYRVLEKAPVMIANRDDTFLVNLLKQRGLSLRDTEYRMTFNAPGIPPAKYALEMRPATEDDDIETLFDDLQSTLIACYNGEPIGKLRIDSADGVSAIYGFVIKPEYRGKGFGRAVLSTVLPNLGGNVYLEVASDNAAALRLYESLGFVTAAVFDYWA